MVTIFMRGELWEVKDEYFERFAELLRRHDFWELEMDIALAWAIKHGYVRAMIGGEDVSERCLEGFENLMKIYGVTWEDIKRRWGGGAEGIKDTLTKREE